MDFQEESRTYSHEVILYRCGCHFCDISEKKLTDLCAQYKAHLKVLLAVSVGLRDWPGWKTPTVYIDGKRISQFAVKGEEWEALIASELKPVSNHAPLVPER